MGKKVVFPCPFNHHHQTKRDAQNYGIGSKKGKKCNCLREKVEINVFEKCISNREVLLGIIPMKKKIIFEVNSAT